MKSFRFLNFLFIISFLSCGGVDLIDDYVPPSLRITTPFTELTLAIRILLLPAILTMLEMP